MADSMIKKASRCTIPMPILGLAMMPQPAENRRRIPGRSSVIGAGRLLLKFVASEGICAAAEIAHPAAGITLSAAMLAGGKALEAWKADEPMVNGNPVINRPHVQHTDADGMHRVRKP